MNVRRVGERSKKERLDAVPDGSVECDDFMTRPTPNIRAKKIT